MSGCGIALILTRQLSGLLAKSYKDDYGVVGLNYLDWTYYIMTAGQATLTGTGDYAGSLLNLAHAPSNYYYGYQVGMGANNTNADYGNGGWFEFTGDLVVGGSTTAVTGFGDLAFDADCCPRYEILRTYTATDCSGNETTVSYTVSFEDISGPTTPDVNSGVMVMKGDAGSTEVYPNPVSVDAQIEFNMAEPGVATVSIYTMEGVYLGEVFNGEIVANKTYTATLKVQDMNNGVYIYKVSNGKSILTNKIVVSK